MKQNKETFYQYFGERIQGIWMEILSASREYAWRNAVKNLKETGEDSYEVYLKLKKEGNVKKVTVTYQC